MEKVSAYNRLKLLPKVFDFRDMEIEGVSRSIARQTCHRWSKAGLIKAAGPRVGVFYNLVREPDISKLRLDAVLKSTSRPVIAIGASSLHFHNWTTQIPSILELAIAWPQGLQSAPKIDGVSFIPRSNRWFALAATNSEVGIEGFLTASPEFAVADIISSRLKNTSPTQNKTLVWHCSPDDLDPMLDTPELSFNNILKFSEILKIPKDSALEYLSNVYEFEEFANNHNTRGF